MPITHIVAFKYPASLPDAGKKAFAERFVALKDQCKGVLSLTAGKENSPEGMSGAYEHVFVLRFAASQNDADRLYYLDHDPAHQEFKAFAAKTVSGAQVWDFEEGVF